MERRKKKRFAVGLDQGILDSFAVCHVHWLTKLVLVDLSGYLGLMNIQTCCLLLEHLHSSDSLQVPGRQDQLPSPAGIPDPLSPSGFFIQPRLMVLLPDKASIAIFNYENLTFYFTWVKHGCT